MAKSIFSGISAAKPTMSATYHGRGRYLMRIDEIKIAEDRKKVEQFIVQMTVVHVIDNENNHPSSHGVGTEVSFLTKKTSDYFLPEVSAFCKAVLGADLTAMDEDQAVAVVDSLISQEQPLAGHVVETYGKHNVTKEGEDRIYCRFQRRLTFTEVAEALSEKEIARFFPGDSLVKLVEAEAKAA